MHALRNRHVASSGSGVALLFLLPIVAVLLLLTVLGLPLGLFVLFALVLIYTVGYTVAAAGVGRLVMRSSSRYVPRLVGLAILRALALVSIAGGLLAAVWGLGLLAVAIRARAMRRPVTASPEPPPMPVAS